MTYSEAVSFLFSQLPSYETQGKSGYKPGLDTTLRLSNAFGNPHLKLRSVHIAGTNGKGSTAHLIAALLQTAGYKVGLFTSPHISDFRERIRINGQMISKDDVVDFLEKFQHLNFEGRPSFFELTTIMAFDYFRRNKVDWAVVETGLGGRLDSTNIILPKLSVITNISLDHTALLGDTVGLIAAEKAGIIKRGVPVVVGNANDDSVRCVIAEKASSEDSLCVFAQDVPEVSGSSLSSNGNVVVETRHYGKLNTQMSATYQAENINTALVAMQQLFKPTAQQVASALLDVDTLTGFAGRWTTLHTNPLVLCDVGHNPAAWVRQVEQLTLLEERRGGHLHFIIAFAADKDVDTILSLLPCEANYYFTQANTSRALTAQELKKKASCHGLTGDAYNYTELACKAAKAAATTEDTIFIGGTFYIIDQAAAFWSN